MRRSTSGDEVRRDGSSEAKRLKALEEENAAEEASGGVDAGRLNAARDARKKLLTPGSRRTAVSWAIEDKGYSQRRACRLVGLDPRVYRYPRADRTSRASR